MRFRLIGAAAAVVVTLGGAGLAGYVSSDESNRNAIAAGSCAPIGFQNGVVASMNRLRRLDPGGTNATRTGAWDKLERTLTILVHDHDAVCSGAPPPVTTTTPPATTTPAVRRAPQAYNRGSSGQDARYCVLGQPGVTQIGPNLWRDEGGARYDGKGLELDGLRSGQKIDVLKPADEMDGRETCDPYTKDGRTFPPYPPQSYER